MQGRLIVFEGTDGSGKATQTALLCQELDRRGIAYRRLEFPRYKEESSALIRLYLSGAFGSRPDDVNAYAAATFYSVDCFASSARWAASPSTATQTSCGVNFLHSSCQLSTSDAGQTMRLGRRWPLSFMASR